MTLWLRKRRNYPWLEPILLVGLGALLVLWAPPGPPAPEPQAVMAPPSSRPLSPEETARVRNLYLRLLEREAEIRGQPDLAEEAQRTRRTLAWIEAENPEAVQGMRAGLAGLRDAESARRRIGRRLRESFARRGIRAEVDALTAEVRIDLVGGTPISQILEAFADGVLAEAPLIERIRSLEVVGVSASPDRAYESARLASRNLAYFRSLEPLVRVSGRALPSQGAADPTEPARGHRSRSGRRPAAAPEPGSLAGEAQQLVLRVNLREGAER